MSSPSGTQVHASQDFWEVEKILKETAHRYLIKWAGLDPETRKPWPDSWVAKVDCTKELIAEWKEKQSKKKRKSKSKDSDAFSINGLKNVAVSKSRLASNKTSRNNSPHKPSKKPSSSKSPTSVVDISRTAKRKQRPSANTDDSDEEEEEQPQKRRKTIQKEISNQSSTTIKVGPPGRAVNYIVKEGFGEPMVTYKKVGARKRASTKVSEHDDDDGDGGESSRESSVHRTSSQSDKTAEDSEVDDDDDRVSLQPQPQPQTVSFKKSPLKNGFTQEIIDETQSYDTSSSSQSVQQAVVQQSPKRNNPIPVIPSPISSRHTSRSPIQTFTSSIKTSSYRNKEKGLVYPKDADDIDSDDAPQIQQQEIDPRLFEKHEEEESQRQPNPQEEDGEESISGSPKQALSTTASSISIKDIIDNDTRKFNSSQSALISVYARLGKVFGTGELDNIGSPNSRSKWNKERPLSPDVEGQHEEPDALPPIEREEDDINEIIDYEDRPPYVTDSHADVDELDTGVGDNDDELGPDDAADNITSSVPGSQIHRINSSMLVNAATTQRTLQPVIESPVRQLDSALGLLHRKSEEIQMLRDQVIQLQESIGKSELRISELKEELVRSEEHREAQGLQVAQLEIELVSAKTEVAIHAVQTALNPEELSLPMEDSAATVSGEEMTIDASQLDSTLIQLRDEIERHKLTITDLERENNVFRNLYTQASTAHLNNLDELKELKRDNASLREQATSGVRQANLFWKTQVATLESRLKQARGETQLMVHQNRATQDIRDRAALFTLAQKETANVQKELDEWKERFGKLGMENTELRIELKGREDEDLTRRRKQREVEEQNKRALESDGGDQLLWICPWRDDKFEKCGVLNDSRESLREHFYQAGHV